MKTLFPTLRRFKLLTRLLLAILCIGLLMFASQTRAADQQGYASSSGTVTNIPAVVNSGAISNSLNAWIPLRTKSGLAMQWTFNTSAGTGNAVIPIYGSVDGTNVCTVPWTWWIVPATSFTNVVAITNWNELQLRGFQALVVGAVTNSTGGIMTNGPIYWNRPNIQ